MALSLRLPQCGFACPRLRVGYRAQKVNLGQNNTFQRDSLEYDWSHIAQLQPLYALKHTIRLLGTILAAIHPHSILETELEAVLCELQSCCVTHAIEKVPFKESFVMTTLE